MTIYKKADHLLKLAYKSGGEIEVEEILRQVDGYKSFIDEKVLCLLEPYGKFYSTQLDSLYGWNVFSLTREGFLFAQSGGYSRQAIKERCKTYSIYAAIASAIAAILTFLCTHLLLAAPCHINYAQKLTVRDNTILDVVVYHRYIPGKRTPMPVTIHPDKYLNGQLRRFQPYFFIRHNHNALILQI